jgi:hypothetical protein
MARRFPSLKMLDKKEVQPPIDVCILILSFIIFFFAKCSMICGFFFFFFQLGLPRYLTGAVLLPPLKGNFFEGDTRTYAESFLLKFEQFFPTYLGFFFFTHQNIFTLGISLCMIPIATIYWKHIWTFLTSLSVRPSIQVVLLFTFFSFMFLIICLFV